MKRVMLLFPILFLLMGLIVSAHSGRTDKYGGHFDHSTGEYHFHHGYPAHQHPGGLCPYAVDIDEGTIYDDSSDSSEGVISRDGQIRQLNLMLFGIRVSPTFVFCLLYLLPCLLLILTIYLALRNIDKNLDIISIAPFFVCVISYLFAYTITALTYSNSFFEKGSDVQGNCAFLIVCFLVLAVSSIIVFADKKVLDNAFILVVFGIPWILSLLIFPHLVVFTFFSLDGLLRVNQWAALICIAFPIVVHILVMRKWRDKRHEKQVIEEYRSASTQRLQSINWMISRLEQDLKQDEGLEDVTEDAVARMVKDGVITNEEADRVIASIRSRAAKEAVYTELIEKLEKEKKNL